MVFVSFSGSRVLFLLDLQHLSLTSADGVRWALVRQVDSTCLGVESLTKRLVNLLTVRIKDALPNMKWELQESLSKCLPSLSRGIIRTAWHDDRLINRDDT